MSLFDGTGQAALLLKGHSRRGGGTARILEVGSFRRPIPSRLVLRYGRMIATAELCSGRAGL